MYHNIIRVASSLWISRNITKWLLKNVKQLRDGTNVAFLTKICCLVTIASTNVWTQQHMQVAMHTLLYFVDMVCSWNAMIFWCYGTVMQEICMHGKSVVNGTLLSCNSILAETFCYFIIQIKHVANFLA